MDREQEVLLWMVAQIHTWERSPHEIIGRAAALVKLTGVGQDVVEDIRRGSGAGLEEMLKKIFPGAVVAPVEFEREGEENVD